MNQVPKACPKYAYVDSFPLLLRKLGIVNTSNLLKCQRIKISYQKSYFNVKIPKIVCFKTTI